MLSLSNTSSRIFFINLFDSKFLLILSWIKNSFSYILFSFISSGSKSMSSTEVLLFLLKYESSLKKYKEF